MVMTLVARVDLPFVPIRRNFVVLEVRVRLELLPVYFWVKAPTIDTNMETTPWEGGPGVVHCIRQYHRESPTIS